MLIFGIVSVVFISFITALIFMISFLLLTFRVLLFFFFPVALGVKSGCLFDAFLVLEVGLYC